MPPDRELLSRVKRIAVTVPPDAWFHGIARALFELYRGALVEMGLEVFDVPVDAFLPPDAARLARLIPQLEAFRPQLALGLSHGAYALICRMPARRDGRRANAFTEVLDVPAICLWDHAPLELADQLLLPLPEGPAESRDGADVALRQALAHPRVVHWSRDSGQTRLMERLGFAAAERVIHEGAPALPGFGPAAGCGGAGVGFVGHIYPEAARYPDPALAALAGDAILSWAERPAEALWDGGASAGRCPHRDATGRVDLWRGGSGGERGAVAERAACADEAEGGDGADRDCRDTRGGAGSGAVRQPER